MRLPTWRCPRGRRGAPRSAAGRVRTGVLTVATLLAAQVTYLTLGPATSASAAPAPGNGSPFDCTNGVLYNVTTATSGAGQLTALDTTTFGNAAITSTPIASLPAGQLAPDALAITADGGTAYTVQGSATAGSIPLYRYDALAQSWATYSGTATDGDRFVAGAIDPHNGIYYYATFDGAAATATIYGFDTAANAPIPGVLATVGLPLTGSGTAGGDLAFDRDGNLYVVVSLGSAAGLSVVDGPLPTTNDGTGDGAALTDRPVRTFNNASGLTYDGIAFGNDGELFVQYESSTTTQLLGLDPNTGDTIDAATPEDLTGTDRGADLAACSLNPTLTGQQNIAARSHAGDQFTVSITGGGVTTGNSATTTGASTGVQDAAAGPVIGVSNTTYTVQETAAAGDLSNYATTYQCTDGADGDQVVAAGTGSSFTLPFPAPANGKTGPEVTCTFTNTPAPASLDTVTTVKTVNGGPPTSTTHVDVGDVIGYAVTTSNTGGLPGSATLTENVPANTTYSGSGEEWSTCPAGAPAGTTCTHPVTLGPGDSVTNTYTVTADTPLAGVKSVRNVVTASAGSCSACTAIYPLVALLDTVTSIHLIGGDTSATPATPVEPGDTVVYDVTVTNSGGSTGSTLVTDDVPANSTYSGSGEGWTCPDTSAGSSCTQTVSSPAGGSTTVAYTVTAGPFPSGTPSMTNTPTSGTGTCSSCTVTNPTAAALDTVKTVSTVNGAPATAATQVGPGDVVGYDITVTNIGGSSGSTTLRDPVPAHTSYTGSAEGWSCPAPAATGTACTQSVTVPANDSVSRSYTITVATPVPSGTLSIGNTVTSSSGTCSACAASNPTVASLDTVTTVATVNGAAATPPTQVQPGDVVIYTVTTTNSGGSLASTVLSDPAPANTTYTGTGQGWSCTAPAAAGTACTQMVTVPANGSVAKAYTVTVDSPLPAATLTIDNRAASSTGSCSSCTTSNPTVAVLDTSEQVVSVNGTPATAATPVSPGDTVQYKITVANTGGSAGTTTLSDDVPADTTYTGTSEGWSCSAPAPAGTSCTHALTVPAQDEVVVRYTVTVASPLPAGTQTVGNAVSTSTGRCSACAVTNPTLPSLDTVATIVTVNGAAATASSQLKAGDVVVYTVTTANTGGSPASTLLSDPVPANTSYTGSGQGWSCPAPATAATACTQTITVPADSAVSKSFTVTADLPLPSGTRSLANAITSSVGSCSACTVTNPTIAKLDTVATITSVNGRPASAATQVSSGDVVDYQITVANTGGSSGATTVTDTVPAHASYSGTPTQGWSCAAGDPAGTVCTHAATVPSSSSASFAYQVTVDAPLTHGVQTIGNDVTTSAGTCSACSMRNPTVASLDTVKTITAVNGSPATATTQLDTGDVVGYTITTTNSGGTSATTTLSDIVPAHTTYTGSAEGWSCAAPAASGTACTQDVTVTANSSTDVGYTLTVGALPAGTQSIVDAATSSGGTCSACTVTNPTVAVLDTTKTVATVNDNPATAATQVGPGDVVGYTITVANTGGSTGTTTLTDVVPAGSRYTGTGEGWTCAGTTAGSSCTQSVSVSAGAAMTKSYTTTVTTPVSTGRQTITNTLTASTGSCSACSVANRTVAALDTVKTLTSVNGLPATPATQVQAGDILGYTITVTNTGGSAGTTTLTDAVPAHTTYTGSADGWSCTAPAATGTACAQDVTVIADDSISVTYTVTVESPLVPGTLTIGNTVTTLTGTCSACAVSNPTIASLDTVKTITKVDGAHATATTQIKAGDVVAYNMIITNSGGSAASTTLTDTVPANTTFTGSIVSWACTAGTCTRDVTVPAGAAVTATFTVTVVGTLPKGTQTISNTASTSNGTCSSCSVTNPTIAALDTVKSIVSVNGAPATAATQVAAGNEITYAVTVTNSGGSAGSTTLTDPVPTHTGYSGSGEGWACAGGSSCTQDVTVAVASTESVQYTVTVAAPLPAGTTAISNTVRTSVGSCSDCTVSNPTVAVLHTVKSLVTINAIIGTAAAQVTRNDVLVYRMTVSNDGGSAGSTTLTDSVPVNTTYTGAAEGWSCITGASAGAACTQTLTVPPGSSVDKLFTMTVNPVLPQGLQTVANTVASSSGTCLPCTVVNPTVGTLSVSKTVTRVNGAPGTTGEAVRAGDVLTYTILAVNSGGASTTTRLSDPVPANATYTGKPTEGWSCRAGSAPGTACTQDITIRPGSTRALTYTMTVSALPKGTALIGNTVTTSNGSCTACSPTNPTVATLDTTQALVTVDGRPAGGLVRVKAGDVLGYDVTVTNSGGSPLATTLVDTVPAHTSHAASGEGWSCSAPARPGTRCTQHVLVAAQSSVTRRFSLTLDSPAPADTRQVTNAVTTSNGSCSRCAVSTPIMVADLVVAKSVDDGSAVVGSRVRFTVRVRNDGPDEATQVSAADVPTGLGYVSSTVTRGRFDASTGVWTIGMLQVGEEAVLTVIDIVNSSGARNDVAVSNPDEIDPVRANNTAAVTLSGGPASAASLADTGTPVLSLAGDGLFLLLAGCGLVLVTRRRRSRPSA